MVMARDYVSGSLELRRVLSMSLSLKEVIPVNREGIVPEFSIIRVQG